MTNGQLLNPPVHKFIIHMKWGDVALVKVPSDPNTTHLIEVLLNQLVLANILNIGDRDEEQEREKIIL